MIWLYGPALVWMALIFMMSAQPKADLPVFGAWDLLVKKGGHFLAYAVLALLLQRGWPDWRLAIGVTAVYAISDEIHQSVVPGRGPSPVDVLIDVAGGLTALALIHWGGYFPLGLQKGES